MSQQKMIEVTAGKTFQAMKDGKVITVKAGEKDSLPESEAKAADDAGVLVLPEESESKPAKKKS